MDKEITPPPFEFQQPPVADAPPATGKPRTHGKNKKRGPRRPPAKAVTVPKNLGRVKFRAATQAPAKPAPIATRRPRKAKRSTIDLSLAVQALSGLSTDDGKLLMTLVGILNGAPKGSRARLVQALGKVFA